MIDLSWHVFEHFPVTRSKTRAMNSVGIHRLVKASLKIKRNRRLDALALTRSHYKSTGITK